MSSRWISISASAPGRSASLTAACAALTSALLPVPRAPHSSTLLAGSPAAKRSVLSSRMSRTRSMPRSRPIGDAVDGRHRLQPLAVGVPDEGVGGAEIVDRGAGRREPLERVGDAVQKRQQVGFAASWIAGRVQRKGGGR